MSPTSPADRYVTGPFAPVTEEITAFDLEVIGELPVELDGRYLRNGPNPIAPVDPVMHHWFTGSGMVHGIRLRDGRAEWYRNRWVRSDEVADALGEERTPGERHAEMDTANTNVVGHAGRTWALVEAGARPIELTDELGTVRHSDLDGTLPHGYAAHPKPDPDTGELHAVGYFWGRPDVLEHTIWGEDGRIRRRTDVLVPGGPMVHDFALTDRYVVLYDLPVTFDLDAVVAGRPLPYTWNDDHPARIGLLPRTPADARPIWFDIEPCYVFHTMRAHEDDGRMIIDAVRHPRMFLTDLNGPNDGDPVLWRWVLDPTTGSVREEQLDDRPVEFPRIDDRHIGRAVRHGWATALSRGDDGVSFDATAVLRYDLGTGTAETIDLGPGRHPGEMVLAPRGPDAEPGRGWYLTLVHDRSDDRSELVVLDTEAPTGGPVARVLLPTRVPLGFHGNWVPTASAAR